MSLSDPIADFLTRIRNALHAHHRFLVVRHSKMKHAIAEILASKGLVESVSVEENDKGLKQLRVVLRYGRDRKPVIRGLKRASKPGNRSYVGVDQIGSFYGGFGLSILSTSLGVLDGESAKKKAVGGELLCRVW